MPLAPFVRTKTSVDVVRTGPWKLHDLPAPAGLAAEKAGVKNLDPYAPSFPSSYAASSYFDPYAASS